MTSRKDTARGFTLIELLLVIAIIAIVAYQTDHDDTSPPRNDGVADFANSASSNFLGSLFSYVDCQHRIFTCP